MCVIVFFVRKIVCNMAVNFYLDNRTNQSGDAPIRVSISIGGSRFITSTGFSINPSKWDNKKRKVKQGCSNSKGITYNTINARFNTIDNFFIEYENAVLKDNLKITQDDIKNVFRDNFGLSKNRSKSNTTKEKTFFDYFDDFVAESSITRQWTVGTQKRFAVTRNHIERFNPNPVFEDFNEEGLIQYVAYFLAKNDMRNSTVTKQLSFLKWFLRWTTKKGYNTNTDYINFNLKLRSSEKKVIFLTKDELLKVYEFPIPVEKNYLDRVRDVFCFCCFSSLRYSDAYNLKRSDITEMALHVTTIKTSDSLIIDQNKFTKAILAKYANIPFKGGKALPVITNQKMNVYLKELGELCGINQDQTIVYFQGSERIEEVYPKYELLSTHAGRRTFICNALWLGIRQEVVMKWTGHKDYKAMQPYIDVADSNKASEMSKFDNL